MRDQQKDNKLSPESIASRSDSVDNNKQAITISEIHASWLEALLTLIDRETVARLFCIGLLVLRLPIPSLQRACLP